jgi:hypothetical protein
MPGVDLNFDGPGKYLIQVKGKVNPEIMEMFRLHPAERAVQTGCENCTQLFLDIKDQSELLGFLNTLYDFHHTICKVEFIARDDMSKGQLLPSRKNTGRT